MDRFDATIDGSILDHCRSEPLIEEAIQGMAQQISESPLITFKIKPSSIVNTAAFYKDVLDLLVPPN